MKPCSFVQQQIIYATLDYNGKSKALLTTMETLPPLPLSFSFSLFPFSLLFPLLFPSFFYSGLLFQPGYLIEFLPIMATKGCDIQNENDLENGLEMASKMIKNDKWPQNMRIRPQK
jgi:hypothetical protein